MKEYLLIITYAMNMSLVQLLGNLEDKEHTNILTKVSFKWLSK